MSDEVTNLLLPIQCVRKLFFSWSRQFHQQSIAFPQCTAASPRGQLLAAGLGRRRWQQLSTYGRTRWHTWLCRLVCCRRPWRSAAASLLRCCDKRSTLQGGSRWSLTTYRRQHSHRRASDGRSLAPCHWTRRGPTPRCGGDRRRPTAGPSCWRREAPVFCRTWLRRIRTLNGVWDITCSSGQTLHLRLSANQLLMQPLQYND